MRSAPSSAQPAEHGVGGRRGIARRGDDAAVDEREVLAVTDGDAVDAGVANGRGQLAVAKRGVAPGHRVRPSAPSGADGL